MASAIADQEFSGFEIVHENVNRGTTRIIEEDALNIATDVLVCPVNPDGVINTEISKRVREVYPEVYQAYIELCNDYNPDVLLGMCQAVPVKNSSKIVCNIFVETESKDCHALRNCLESIADRYPGSNIAIPYSLIHIGHGEAREVIQNELVNAGCNVVLCRPRA